MRIAAKALVGIALVAGLAWFYVVTALDHARVVNTVKARGDQSAYLYEAQILYRNWHGLNDPVIVQPRNRMPLYPALLALFYDPRWTDWEFFDVAKAANVYLSLALLAATGLVLVRQLPALPAVNVWLIVAFGIFIFKAGYTQAELLFYTLHFLSFVACWRMFLEPDGTRRLAYAAAAGASAGLAHLTKAAVLPFVALAVAVSLASAMASKRSERQRIWAAAVPLVLATTYLLVLAPYLSTSKRVHGQYFYNLNSAALAWYDGYAEASVALLSYGPDGWPPGPRSSRPGPVKYWREHTPRQIGDRLWRGLADMVAVSYRGYWFFKFLGAYLLAVALVLTTRRAEAGRLVRRHVALAIFLVSYAGIYLPLIAFYEPISATGTARFLLAHIPPVLFALTTFLANPAIEAARWRMAGADWQVRHMHLLIAVALVFDIVFVVRQRVMATYGGF